MKELTAIQFVIIRGFLYDCLERIEFGRNDFEMDADNGIGCLIRFNWAADYFEGLKCEAWDKDGNYIEIDYDQLMELEKVLYLKWDKSFN
jgi:hypothetical protein